MPAGLIECLVDLILVEAQKDNEKKDGGGCMKYVLILLAIAFFVWLGWYLGLEELI